MSYPKTRGGDEMTPEFLEELAEEAEDGFEGWQWKVVHRGRPPLSKGTESQRLNIRITPDMGESIAQIAEARETTVSAIVREALDRYLADAA